MLTKKDKAWIKEAIKEAVTEALTVEWTIEKVRDDKTGQPLAVSEKKKEKVYIPSVFLQLLPYHEGALRGMQEDLNKNNNKINSFEKKLNSVGNIIMQTEESLKCIAAIGDNIKQIASEPNSEKYLIEEGVIVDEQD